MIVYLAGGMRSNWQDRVIHAVSGVEWRDPRSHGLTEEKEYTKWDLYAVQECDVVFAYMDHDNPSGYGMCLEMGYAHALGKKIILVDMRSPVDARFRNWMGMARSVAHYNARDMEDGIFALLKLL
jgi:nucleoside 2-deoxyribosyltransferase